MTLWYYRELAVAYRAFPFAAAALGQDDGLR